jgi:hypothetical protein
MVAKTAKAERIGNTMKDPRYIMDDERRLSELTVPVIVDGRMYSGNRFGTSAKEFLFAGTLHVKRNTAICSAKISLQVYKIEFSKIARST